MNLHHALIDWDDPKEDGGNTAHVAEHDLTPAEIESALLDGNTTFDVSDSSGLPFAFGTSMSGRFIAIVFEVLNVDDPLILRPITAYEVPKPTK